MTVLAGEKIRAQDIADLQVDVAALQLNGIPVIGQWRSTTGAATSAGTELTTVTAPAFTPEANTIYWARFALRYSADASGGIFFTRIYQDSTEKSASRFDPVVASSPQQATDCDFLFNSGSSPASTTFSGRVIRNSGAGAVTPLAFTNLIVWKLGASSLFTNV